MLKLLITEYEDLFKQFDSYKKEETANVLIVPDESPLSWFPLLGINHFSMKVSVKVYNVMLVSQLYAVYDDQDVTIVARYINQKGYYYTLQLLIKYQKYHNKWMCGFFIIIYMKKGERMRRKWLTEDDIPHGVMLCLLRVAYIQSPRGFKVDITNFCLYCH